MQCHLPRTAAAFLYQEKGKENRQIEEDREYFHYVEKAFFSTCGQDLTLTNCLIEDSHASQRCFIALLPSFITLFPICILRGRTKMIF